MNWYIDGDIDKKAYSKHELDEILERENKSVDEFLIKNDHMDSFLSYGDIFSSDEKIDELPSLPEVPSFVEESVEQNDLPDIPQAPSAPPELPIEKVEEPQEAKNLDDVEQMDLIDEEFETINISEDLLAVDEILSDDDIHHLVNEDKKLKLKEYLSKRNIALFLAALVFLALLSFFFFFLKTPIAPKNLSLDKESIKQINHIIGANESKQALFFDGNSFVFATNNMGEGEIFIEGKSLSKKILSRKQVEFKATTKIVDGVAIFKSITFNKGNEIIPGYYSIKVAEKDGLKKDDRYMLRPFSKQIMFFKTKLLAPVDERAFAKKLKTYLETKDKNTVLFKSELREKYRTLKTIVTQIKESLSDAFANSEMDWLDRVKKFEDNYMQKYGRFFTSFVIANEESFSQINKKEFPDKIEVISDYTRLSRLAKTTGKISAGVMQDFNSFEFENAFLEDILALKEKSLSSYREIIKECNERIKTLNLYLDD